MSLSECGLALVTALSLGGCFLDRGAIEPGRDAARWDAGAGSDAGAIDAARTDAGAGLDAGVDAGPPDAGPPDTGPPDAGPPDAGPPSCDSLYRDVPGYILCEERADECEMVALLASIRSCASTCAAFGGRCITAYRNELPYPPCERQGDAIPCDTIHVDDICICSRGP